MESRVLACPDTRTHMTPKVFQVTTTLFLFLSKLLIPSCRYKGYYEYAKLKGLEVGPPVGLDILVDGTVPTGKFLNFNYINCMS